MKEFKELMSYLKSKAPTCPEATPSYEDQFASSSMGFNSEEIKFIVDSMPFASFKSKLLYRGSRDGFGNTAFHKHVDGYGPSITFLKASNGRVGGAYTTLVWGTKPTSTSHHSVDDNAFLLSPSTKTLISPLRKGEQAVLMVPSNGPNFGVAYLGMFGNP
jgi:hypothetical protein